MLLGIRPVGEAAGAFQRDFDAVLLVGQLSRIAPRRHRDLLAVDHHRVLGRVDRAVENPVHGVVLEEVGERLRLVDVVDQDDVEARAALERGAQDVATDPAEAVDGETSHVEASLGEAQIGSELRSVKATWSACLRCSLALRLQVLRDQIDQLRRERE